MKISLLIFGIRKEYFLLYLVEFMWCYKYKDSDLFKVFLRDMKVLYKFNWIIGIDEIDLIV